MLKSPQSRFVNIEMKIFVTICIFCLPLSIPSLAIAYRSVVVGGGGGQCQEGRLTDGLIICQNNESLLLHQNYEND